MFWRHCNILRELEKEQEHDCLQESSWNHDYDIVHGCRQLAFLCEEHGHSSRQQFVICSWILVAWQQLAARKNIWREKKASSRSLTHNSTRALQQQEDSLSNSVMGGFPDDGWSERPRGSPGVRGKICVTKKGGALENEVKRGRGTLKWGD